MKLTSFTWLCACACAGAIVSLSLAGPCVMEFRRGAAQRAALLLPPRSLLVMAVEARYGWCHYIPHRRSDVVAGARTPRAPRRVSFTFRQARARRPANAAKNRRNLCCGRPKKKKEKMEMNPQHSCTSKIKRVMRPAGSGFPWVCVDMQVRGFPCACAWPALCDSQGGGLPPTRMAQLAAEGSSAQITGPEAALIRAALARSGAKTGSKEGAAAAAEAEVDACSSSSEPAVQCDASGKPAAGDASSSGGDAAVADCPCTREGAASTADSGQISIQEPPGHERRGSGQGAGTSGREESGCSSEAHLEQLEALHVHSVYDIIADHFSATRFAVWPKVFLHPWAVQLPLAACT